MSDNARLAVVLRSAQWELDEVAFVLPRGEVTAEQRERLAATLVTLAELLLGTPVRGEVVSGRVAIDAPEEPQSSRESADDPRRQSLER